MSVSKRLRYEVLRRDGHTCRYCGAKAPDVKLTVDHVVPTALGGSDEPGNLVTACADCNSGKSATPADAALVADVAEDALRWANAMVAARERQEADELATTRRRAEVYETFRGIWEEWTYTAGRNAGQPVALPDDWRLLVDRLVLLGAEGGDFRYAIEATMQVHPMDQSAYLYSVMRNRIEQRQAIARGLLAGDD